MDKYIEKTYGVEYKFKNAIYNRKYIGRYALVVEIDGEIVQLLPSVVGTFKDINQQERLDKINEEFKWQTNADIGEAVANLTYITGKNVSYKYEYTKVGVKPDALMIEVTIDSEDTDVVYNEIATVLNRLLSLEYNVHEVVVTLNNTSLYISKDNFELITPEYIEGGFKIEDLDE